MTDDLPDIEPEPCPHCGRTCEPALTRVDSLQRLGVRYLVDFACPCGTPWRTTYLEGR